MLIFYIFAGLLVLQSAFSLLEGVRYLAYVRRSLATAPGDFTPVVAIIAPCKGIDEAMGDYLKSLFELDYPNYQIVFVVESDRDGAAAEIARWQSVYPVINARCVVAGPSQHCGQKVHNLLTAIDTIGAEVEAFAFVDSDVCLPRRWLRNLIAPLAEAEFAATTGYRWFVPTDRRFASVLRAAWNGSTATALGDHGRNFAWGGSMAILRETFEQLEVRRYWQGTISDDYGLTRAVREANRKIKFVPACLVPSLGGCSFGELMEFTTRQIIITRIYSAGLWKVLLVSNLIFNLVFFSGIVLSLYQAINYRNWWPLILIAIIYLLGVGKGYLRVEAMRLALSDYQAEILRDRITYYWLTPVVALIFLLNLLGSLRTNRITWRGISYELRSHNETVIARQQ